MEGVSEQVLGPVMLRAAGGPDPVRTLELRALAEAAAGRLTPAVTRFPLAEAAGRPPGPGNPRHPERWYLEPDQGKRPERCDLARPRPRGARGCGFPIHGLLAGCAPPLQVNPGRRSPPLVGPGDHRLAQLMVVLDATIVNIALPSAQRDLGMSDGNRQWVITAYTLAFGGLLLLGGRIADLVGRNGRSSSG